MPSNKTTVKRRSGCPLNASVEMLGDRWSLLIIRDMMLRGFRSYKEFLESYEGIATNILADRLRKLEAYGVIVPERDPSDGRKVIYRLTAKGIDLAPVMSEMVLWAAAHEDTRSETLVKGDTKGQGRIYRRNSGNAGRKRISLRRRSRPRVKQSLSDSRATAECHRRALGCFPETSGWKKT